ncbi:PREDICTED: UBN2_3 domain-containing [Prunus dulcis]|uniref:PREDICTED: UBN2_3 domain-containing n=1 Tax=Prunus dulcis TaxID=3755 RepID=A0A5E4F9G5_PRUDU|nr:PREDICTED: UBN2_3 domain-containing [Prunus dulcis]
MEPSVMNLFIHLPTAKNFWEAASQACYEGADRSISYDLSCKAMETNQAGRLVASYFSDLKAIWKELDHCKTITFTHADVIKVC